MTIEWVYDGTVERIPPIGTQFSVPWQQWQVLFQVDAYGETEQLPQALHPGSTGESHKLELIGHIIIPKGSPMELLEAFLGSGL